MNSLLRQKRVLRLHDFAETFVTHALPAVAAIRIIFPIFVIFVIVVWRRCFWQIKTVVGVKNKVEISNVV